MIIKKEVNNLLHLIHLQRNKNVWIFHVVLLLASTSLQKEKIVHQHY
jgi:hypothetical protein